MKVRWGRSLPSVRIPCGRDRITQYSTDWQGRYRQRELFLCLLPEDEIIRIVIWEKMRRFERDILTGY